MVSAFPPDSEAASCGHHPSTVGSAPRCRTPITGSLGDGLRGISGLSPSPAGHSGCLPSSTWTNRALRPDPAAVPVELDFPFRGRWLVQNSPDRRVPSHGTHLFGTTYAIDFVPVDERGRSAPRTWRSLVSVEAEIFVGFGRPVLAPVAGTVVAVHDGEPDHEARRSQPALLAYALIPGWARASRSDRDRREPRRHRARLHRTVRPARAPAERQRLRPAGRRGEAETTGHLWQLGQQHRAARSCPGHGLDRAGDRPRVADRVPRASGRVRLGEARSSTFEQPAEAETAVPCGSELSGIRHKVVECTSSTGSSRSTTSPTTTCSWCRAARR